MMAFEQYADMRLGLEARLRETYEEELEEGQVLELERKQLVNALAENFSKFRTLHQEKEELRQGIKISIEKLEAEYARKEVTNG